LASVSRFPSRNASGTSTVDPLAARTRSASSAASPNAVAASYIEAFATGSPVSSVRIDWYSNNACRNPWVISGWYWV